MPTESHAIYVAPDGSDQNSGALTHPLASLAGARDAVRRARVRHAGQNITVWFAGGTYPVEQTIVFGIDDSADEGRTITYCALPNQRPIFSAGTTLLNWRPVESDSVEFSPKALGKVYVADLPETLGRFHTLFQGLTRMPRAGCAGFTPPARAPRPTQDDELFQLTFPPGAIKPWQNLADIELSIIPFAPWGMNVLPLESIDINKGVARTALRGSYPLSKPMFGKFPQGSVFVENVLEAIDAPGRWAVDFTTRKLYLWPIQGVPGTASEPPIIAAGLTELVRIEGRIDYDGPRDTPVKGLVFRGLTFVHADRFTLPIDHRGKGLQHDWEMFDSPSAMFRFRGAERCAVLACHFTASGASAIRLDLHCQHIQISQNLIENVGGVGILLAGYGPGLKDVNTLNEITNNHIHHIGQTYWQSPAIFIWQSGSNHIANNLIHNTPYTAIVVSGRITLDRSGNAECSKTVRWCDVDAFLGITNDASQAPWANREPLLHARKNVLLQNEIHHVMEILEDGDGIYISGAGAGNVIRGNYIHDCPSVHMAEAIRCDDDQHESLIDGNILHRIGGLGTCITIKGTAVVTNNIMATPLNPPYCGLLSLEHAEAKGSIVQRNIFYTARAGDKPVRQGKTIYDNESYLRDMDSDSNLYHNTADSSWGETILKGERPHGIEINSISADPLFLDESLAHFAFRLGSAALNIGFVPVEMEQMGLQQKAGPDANGTLEERD